MVTRPLASMVWAQLPEKVIRATPIPPFSGDSPTVYHILPRFATICHNFSKKSFSAHFCAFPGEKGASCNILNKAVVQCEAHPLNRGRDIL